MGFGGFQRVPLKRAREKAIDARLLLDDGKDPMSEKIRSDPSPTFREAADAYFEKMQTRWRNAKHRAQWIMTIDVYRNLGCKQGSHDLSEYTEPWR